MQMAVSPSHYNLKDIVQCAGCFFTGAITGIAKKRFDSEIVNGISR
jgi:hypothetical protein